MRSSGASPVSAEGKGQPQARGLHWLTRPSLGSRTQGSPAGLYSCVYPFFSCSQGLAQRSGCSLGLPATPTTLAYRVLVGLGNLHFHQGSEVPNCQLTP